MMKHLVRMITAFLVTLLLLLPLQGLANDFILPGQFVQIDNGMPIWVSRYGTGDKPIVFLAGLGAESPTLEFKPMAEELIATNPAYSVYVIEYPGTGLSNQTKTPRTIENITSELHSVIEKLGIAPFMPIVHSISGIYMLYYIDQYPEDVKGFIGIDNSVPAQAEAIDYSIMIEYVDQIHEMTNIPVEEINPEDHPEFYINVNDYTYSDAEEALFMQLFRNTYNPTVFDEVKRITENCAAARNLKFPADLPVLMLVARESSIEPDGIPGWIEMHEELMTSDKHEMIVLDGPHYLHFAIRNEIMPIIFEYLNKNYQ